MIGIYPGIPKKFEVGSGLKYCFYSVRISFNSFPNCFYFSVLPSDVVILASVLIKSLFIYLYLEPKACSFSGQRFKYSHFLKLYEAINSVSFRLSYSYTSPFPY